MKKNVLLIVILVAFIFSAKAQKIKVKKDEVLIDKVPIAKIEGESGLVKGTNLTYKSLDGTPLFNVKVVIVNFFIPGTKRQSYFEITFYNPTKVMRYDIMENGAGTSKKKIAELMFVKTKPALIKENSIDPSALQEFVANYDVMEKLKKDSAKNVGYENELIEKLKNSKIKRDLNEPVICKHIEGGNNYEIIQDGKVIGWIEKKVSDSMGGTKTEFWVFKKFQTPQVIDGETVESGFAAYVLADSFPKIWIMQNKKKSDTKITTLQKLAEYMVQNYLL